MHSRFAVCGSDRGDAHRGTRAAKRENQNAMLFRVLDEKEKAEFRQWARENYKPGDPIKGIWHTIVQEECVAMNVEWSASFNARSL